MSREKAQEFFSQLEEFSERYVKAELKLDSSISPWGYDKYPAQQPMGAVLHFTADEDFDRVLRWFLKEKYQSKSSAHVVVGDRRVGSTDSLAEGLDLVQALPVTVVQCRRPDQAAWHATWTNQKCYGIENINAGELRTQDADSFTSWRPRDRTSPEWTMPWSVPYKTPVELYDRWWAPYPADQVEANITILRYLRDLYPAQLSKPWVLGHEQVQAIQTKRSSGKRMNTDKRDPGPSFPTSGIREAVFDDWTPVGHYDWFKWYCGDHRYGESVRDGYVIAWAKYEAERLGESLEKDPSPEAAWGRFASAIEALPAKKDEPFGVLGKTGLRLLEYHLTDPLSPSLDSDDLKSLWLFQKLMGLKGDHNPGPATRWALVERLKDRGILD